MREQTPPPPPAATAAGAQDRLKALDDLRAQGLVNDDEYGIKRQQILDDL
jgi:hypothetical protein